MWTPIEVYQGQPGTAETTMATVPASRQWVIKEFVLCNATATNRTVTVHVRRGGAAADATRRVISAMTIAANSTVYFPCSIVLNTGGIISGLVSVVSTITITVSAEERVV